MLERYLQICGMHDMEVGGGRIIGEACHYVDLITYLTGSNGTGSKHAGDGRKPEGEYRQRVDPPEV
ncbi:MAG: hypothetical protein U5K69_07705 [Balneolaceae bacterium]|nr:hypothetical protein [Balneolaceae bacterium]